MVAVPNVVFHPATSIQKNEKSSLKLVKLEKIELLEIKFGLYKSFCENFQIVYDEPDFCFIAKSFGKEIKRSYALGHLLKQVPFTISFKNRSSK